jgi:hypothetical protein
MTLVRDKQPEPESAPAKEGKATNTVVESYPSKSVIAAGEMASAEHGSPEGRANYSRILIEESRNLGAYIVGKRTGSSVRRSGGQPAKRRA